MASRRYHPFPPTHWSLVRRAGFAEGADRREALATLLSRYEPALLSYLQQVQRIPDETAKDILQEFIADKVLEYRLLEHSEQGRGRFRTFLLTSLKRFVIDRFRRQNREISETAEPLEADALIAAGNGSPMPEEVVAAAWAKTLIHEVLATMREECQRTERQDVWTVFEVRVLAELFERKAPIPYDELARQLALGSPTQAANLLITAKRMYARLLRAAVGEYEMKRADVDAEIAELKQALQTPEPA